MYTKHLTKTTEKESTQIYNFKQDKDVEHSYYLIEKFMSRNIYKGNTLFSYPQLINSFSCLEPVIRESDIIQLHWINRILSIGDIAYLSHQNKPIVWTVHDKNIYSGGCHYFIGCEEWKHSCKNCPQLIHSLNNMPERVFDTKNKYFNFENITLVVLNKEFKHLVSHSPLLRNCGVHIIPNSIDTIKYTPKGRDVQAFKYKHKIPQGKILILYVSSYESKIKGYAEFCNTMDKIKDKEKFHIILAGSLPEDRNFSIPFTYLGFLQELDLIEVYKNVDATVVSSIEDNLPNICLESISCGTPVFAFKVGGLPDIILNDINGYTVSNGDCFALARAIETSTADVSTLSRMSSQSRDYALKQFSPENQSKAYINVYQEIIQGKKYPRAISSSVKIEELEALTQIRDFKSRSHSKYLELLEWHRENLQSQRHKVKSFSFYFYYFIFQSKLFQLFYIKSKNILKKLLPKTLKEKIKEKLK